MSNDFEEIEESPILPSDETSESSESAKHSNYTAFSDENVKSHLTGMYRSWFLSYASYVILERAVPHLNDGLKPVQRRILHSMKRLDDGRYNKVANVIGHTMQFHPHGDASIGDAMVQIGQKDLMIDCQGNWGNILTGDGAAAPRYIEARLTKFALDIAFNNKTTEWKLSYDGRNKEPVTLPVKYPLLLAQGVEGIAVGLTSRILPHNFNELLDASIACLRKTDFQLLPDFQTGGYVDVSRYNDGERGGSVKIRSKIEKRDSKTLVVTEIPFGTTTSAVIDSILKANDKGKIKIKKIDDNTAQHVEILIHLLPNTSSDKTIDALYAFTSCEVSISPNCCVIADNKPHFLNVSTILRHNTERTKYLLQLELEIEKGELLEQLMFSSLEKIFIEERIYKDKKFEESKSMDEAVAHIDHRLIPFKPLFIREITKDDILRLMEIKMGRILKFNSDKADEQIAKLKERVEQIDHDISHIVEFAIHWFEYLRDKYGKQFPRMTEIRNFENIEATTVMEATEKLYVNREEGFIGTSLKKDEYICPCSPIDDIIVFYKDGRYKVIRVSEKLFVGKGILYLNIFKKNDKRTIYNVAYRDGRKGPHYIKRFAVTGTTRDKEYDLTQGTDGSRVVYFSANPNGEAEVVRVILKPNPRLRKVSFEEDFGEIAIKGRQAMGNLLTKNELHKVILKSKGGSTLGGRQVWFDWDVSRLNYDGRGQLLGEFHSGELLLVTLKSGEFYTCGFDPSKHFEFNVERIERFNPNKEWTAVLFDGEQGFIYLKRLTFEASNKKQYFVSEHSGTNLMLLSDKVFSRFKVTFGGNDSFREALELEAADFIAVKSFKAKGKRISTYEIESIEELEPTRFPDPEPSTQQTEIEPEDDDNVDLDEDALLSDSEIRDRLTGQQRLQFEE